MTEISVVDAKMTDEQLIEFETRVSHIRRDINEGTIPYDWAMTEMRRIMEYRAPGLLKHVFDAHVSAVTKFVAKDVFAKENSAGIRYWLGPNFEANFLDKIEENIPETELSIFELTVNSFDASIRAELTPEYEETMLAHLYELICRQPMGEGGQLLVDGIMNIFYIRDAKGVVWAVRVAWDSVYRWWLVDACSVSEQLPWEDYVQAVSRKPPQASKV
jgi:hypothetical protein